MKRSGTTRKIRLGSVAWKKPRSGNQLSESLASAPAAALVVLPEVVALGTRRYSTNEWLESVAACLSSAVDGSDTAFPNLEMERLTRTAHPAFTRVFLQHAFFLMVKHESNSLDEQSLRLITELRLDGDLPLLYFFSCRTSCFFRGRVSFLNRW